MPTHFSSVTAENTMLAHTLRIILTIGGYVLTSGSTDPNRCISKSASNSAVISRQYCLMMKRDVKLLCPTSKIVVLTGLQMVTKDSSEFCMKRVLQPRNEFCCYEEPMDSLYDSHCLQSLWNKEDRNYYNTFIRETLNKCDNVSQCVLKYEMFSKLQKEIPSTGKYSSYFKVLYKCIPGPTNTIKLCSSKSAIAKIIHLQGGDLFGSKVNKTCTCRVTSRGGGKVIVRAVDVRTDHSGLILRSKENVKNITFSAVPYFGFTEIFSAKKVVITSSLGSAENTRGHSTWMHMSESNGKDVLVACGENAPRIKSTSTASQEPTLPNRAVKRVFWGYWPLIYVASGSIFTIVLVCCILTVIMICRCRKKKKRRNHPCIHTSLPSPADFHQDPYDAPYATVMDDPRTARSSASQNIDFYANATMRTNPKSLSMSGLTHQTPSISSQGAPRSNVEGAGPSYIAPPTPSDVSQLEAFLRCRDSGLGARDKQNT